MHELYLIIAQIEYLQMRQTLVGSLKRFHGGHLVIVEIDSLQIGYIFADYIECRSHNTATKQWTEDRLQIGIGMKSGQI